MSLAVDDGDRPRGHSRSRSHDQRPSQDPDRRESSYVYPKDDLDDRYGSKPSRRRNDAPGPADLPYPAQGGMDPMLPGSRPLYTGTGSSSYDDTRPIYRSSRAREEEAQLPGAFPGNDALKRDSSDERRRRHYSENRDSRYSRRDDRSDKDEPRVYEPQDEKLKYLPQKYSRRYDEDDEDSKKRERRKKKERELEEDLAYGQLPPPMPQRSSRYDEDDGDLRRRPISPRVDEHGSDRPRHDSSRNGHRSSKSQDLGDDRRPYHEEPRDSKSNVLAVDPGSRDRDRSRDRRKDRSPGPPTLTVEPERRDRSRSRDGRGSTRDKSPHSLSVNTGRPSGSSLSAAPASPLLESYHGTYQDCSPMPSPLLLASQNPSEISRSIEPLSPPNSDGDGNGGKRPNRRARFHDPEDIASRLARALKGHHHAPDIDPLIEILPSLTHDQVMELRAEYKRVVKTGSERKGVNVAKHIRARLKDEEPILMKACYAVALGRWESEAYWANFWYQGDKTRRELLIESLMGRSNGEIRRIKDAFTDKKYDNSLTRCMKTELKEDKFKKAVLMVLDERRMEEYDHNGRRIAIDARLVDDDVDDLHRAVRSEKGGETLMISIIVQRSDSHLRLVLQEYERHYRANFAREALKKSGNLVGELLAHILNGVINRPVRDALLLHHALTASRKDSLRRELLISRLVRFHWDPVHMQDVKRAYHERYGQDLQDAVREATTGQWGLFCRELCIARMPDDVRRMERMEIIR